MTKFSEYDKVLNYPEDDQWWYDFEEDIAISFLEQFNKNDWATLSTIWFKKPQMWQIHCAQTLSEGEIEKSLPILLSMLQSENQELVEVTVDSLNALLSYGARIKLNSNELSIVNKLRGKSKLVDKLVVHFLQKLSQQN